MKGKMKGVLLIAVFILSTIVLAIPMAFMASTTVIPASEFTNDASWEPTTNETYGNYVVRLKDVPYSKVRIYPDLAVPITVADLLDDIPVFDMNVTLNQDPEVVDWAGTLELIFRHEDYDPVTDTGWIEIDINPATGPSYWSYHYYNESEGGVGRDVWFTAVPTALDEVHIKGEFLNDTAIPYAPEPLGTFVTREWFADWELYSVSIQSQYPEHDFCVDNIVVGGVTYNLEPAVLDADFYETGDTVSVTVYNMTGNKNPDVQDIMYPIKLESSSDYPTDVLHETSISVMETGVNTGIFTGTFDLVDVTPGTAELLVTKGLGIHVETFLVGIVDETAPVVVIDAPIEFENVTGVVKINATITDANPTTEIIYINGQIVGNVTDPETLPYDWNTTEVDDGAYTITVTSTDGFGHITSESITVTVDNTDPVIEDATATPPVVYPGEADTIVFTATVTDATSGIESVTIDLGSITGALVPMLDDGVGSDLAEADGIYTVNLTTTGIDAGEYTLTLTATDYAECDMEAFITFVSSTDIESPVITEIDITYPVGVVSARVNDSVIISANITDNGVLSNVVLSNSTDFMNNSAMELVSGLWTKTYEIPDSTEAKSYNVTLTATDDKGNFATETFIIEVTTKLTGYYVDLEVGWNLFSLPLMPDDSSIEIVLADVMENVTIVWGYKDGTWSKYLPGLPEFSALTDLVDGEGYWVLMNADDTVTVSGVELPSPGVLPPVYDVVEGWNLIGYKSVYSMDIDDYLTTIPGTVLESAVSYGWDSTVQAYDMVYLGNFVTGFTNFNPGQGYWLYLTEDACIAPPTG